VPGLGLLLLRAAVGGILVAQGVSGLGLTSGIESTFQNSILPILEVLSGASLLLGLMTAIGGALAVLLHLGMVISWLPRRSGNILQTNQALIVAAVMAAALVLLGPGAFSLDSLLFGRREVILPRNPRPPET